MAHKRLSSVPRYLIRREDILTGPEDNIMSCEDWSMFATNFTRWTNLNSTSIVTTNYLLDRLLRLVLAYHGAVCHSVSRDNPLGIMMPCDPDSCVKNRVKFSRSDYQVAQHKRLLREKRKALNNSGDTSTTTPSRNISANFRRVSDALGRDPRTPRAATVFATV